MVKYYAVVVGVKPGIYDSWPEAERNVRGFRGAKHKSFPTRAQAEEYLSQESNGKSSSSSAGDIKVCKESPPQDRLASHSQLEEIQQKETRREYVNYIYTDGSSRKGISGYGFHIIFPNGTSYQDCGQIYPEDYGAPADKATHCNDSELYAVLKACQYLESEKIITPVVIRSDSIYVVNTFQTWIHTWKKKGWVTAKGTPPADSELIKMIDKLLSKLNVTFEHVSAHVGIPDNEKADKLSKMGRLKAEKDRGDRTLSS